MKSPQSPHSSSLWVFALRYSRVLSSSPTSALKSLGHYTFSTVLLFVGLRVISVTKLLKHCHCDWQSLSANPGQHHCFWGITDITGKRSKTIPHVTPKIRHHNSKSRGLLKGVENDIEALMYKPIFENTAHASIQVNKFGDRKKGGEDERMRRKFEPGGHLDVCKAYKKRMSDVATTQCGYIRLI